LKLARSESITPGLFAREWRKRRARNTGAMPERKAHTGNQLRGQADRSRLTEQLQLEMRLAK